MRILITNDDGVQAEGLRWLCETMGEMGELVVVVPDRPRSASSHSVTQREPLRLVETTILNGPPAYLTNGTPADCVALGVLELAQGGVDLVVSGINHGWNLGIDTSYSGTVMAVAEASLLSLPGLAISVGGREPTRFATAAWFAKYLAESVQGKGLPEGTFLNINVPALPRSEIKGVAITSLSLWTCREAFEKRSDPYDGTYYWRGGVQPVRRTTDRLVLHDAPPGTDTHAVFQGFVSVTPLRLDLTDIGSLEALRCWGLGEEACLQAFEASGTVVPPPEDGRNENQK